MKPFCRQFPEQELIQDRVKASDIIFKTIGTVTEPDRFTFFQTWSSGKCYYEGASESNRKNAITLLFEGGFTNFVFLRKDITIDYRSTKFHGNIFSQKKVTAI